MNIKHALLVLLCLIGHTHLNAQDITTVEAMDSSISENLDLEAVASIFGESEDLEDFEKRLNDPNTQISNLDLNNDGEVDYLRVIENSNNGTHVVTIQAVIAKDQYQDVAVIDVEKDNTGETKVQVVGDVSMYGPSYIVEPVYVRRPVIFVWFWGPRYRPWRSPFYWGYYPPYYRPWRPYPIRTYRTNVRVRINVRNTYRRTTVRRSKSSVQIQNRARRNDYKAKVSNTKQPANKATKSTGRPVQKDWKPQTQKKGTTPQTKNNKVSVPTKRPATKPSVKPVTRPSSGKPANRPATRPTTRPATKPTNKPAARPAAKPIKKATPAKRSTINSRFSR
ncbi:hypothetical protein VOI54_00325 [Tamlana sp. 2201CG12-4]|uniref:hypothetical protein n=1 Tax=Tamlana sp. 2201CG12-4 TaxID=3112582 RepID=UPI002DBB4F57|nr:hypothetical protein [Tamlana sp. 2201CG12-4]MEC3905452.1 hypothetical protein [Tamlana sp. 2201CG12-4]